MTTCEVCATYEEYQLCQAPSATSYCVDCCQKLCEACSRPHRAWRGGPHQVRPLGPELDNELQEISRNYCERHKTRLLELYCYDCNSNICLLCGTREHKQHKYDHIVDFLQELQRFAQRLQSRTEEIQYQLDQMKNGKQTFIDDIGKVEESVRKKGEEVKSAVDRQVMAHVEQLRTAKSDTLKEVGVLIEDAEVSLVKIQSLAHDVDELRTGNRRCDIAREMDEKRQLSELMLQEKLKAERKPCSFPKIVFKPTESDDGMNLVGCLDGTALDAAEVNKEQEDFPVDDRKSNEKPTELSSGLNVCEPVSAARGNKERQYLPVDNKIKTAKSSELSSGLNVCKRVSAARGNKERQDLPVDNKIKTAKSSELSSGLNACEPVSASGGNKERQDLPVDNKIKNEKSSEMSNGSNVCKRVSASGTVPTAGSTDIIPSSASSSSQPIGIPTSSRTQSYSPEAQCGNYYLSLSVEKVSITPEDEPLVNATIQRKDERWNPDPVHRN